MRTERIGNATLYLGDCRDVELTADAVLSDPPYGIGYRHSGHVGGVAAAIGITASANKRGSPSVIGDDGPFDPTPWLKYRSVLLWGADHFFSRLPDSGRWLGWNKLGGMKPWDTFSDIEFAWHSGEGAARIFSMLWKGLACDKRGEENGLREHPMQKPVRLMRWCLEQMALPASSVVLDPYMGAGTTGIACAQFGHRFVGVEIEPKYFEMACRRIEAEARQERLAL